MHSSFNFTSLLKCLLPKFNRQDRVVAFTVLFYIFSAISMVLLNKLVLQSTNYPILFLWLQLCIAVVLLEVMHMLGIIHVPKLEWKLCQKLLPLVFMNAVGLSANTFCLQAVDASLFQVNYPLFYKGKP